MKTARTLDTLIRRASVSASALLLVASCSDGQPAAIDADEEVAASDTTIDLPTDPAEDSVTDPVTTSDGDSEPVDSAEDGVADMGDAGSGPLSFPLIAVEADCDDSSGPTLAEWVGSADVVALGTVVELRAAPNPWVTVRGGQPVDECEVPARRGIDLVLERATYLAGSGADTLTVRIAAADLSTWTLQPTVTDDVVEWVDDARTSGLEPGMRVGGFLSAAEGTDIFFSIAPFLWLDDETVAVQRNVGTEDCEGSRPIDGLAGLTVERSGEILAEGELGSTRADVTDWVSSRYAQSNFCDDDPPEPFPCRESDGHFYCPDDLVCDTDRMICVEAEE